MAYFESLAQLGTWLHINQAIDVDTHVQIEAPIGITDQFERLMLDLNRVFEDAEPMAEAFELPSFSHRQLYILHSHESDCEFGLPALKRIEVISQNSWGEHYCHQFEGQVGFFDALTQAWST